ncbi:ABC transporter substrate-binding protein [Aristaeella lactis]|uniref:Extracellular solute-binding protein, family 5 Middle n=1 Tax=Aristaeella lactis TaxID=3046383 RepID=A0AC61PJI4_9FIRM|nr:ABC transporter substrate-binding protein [Aristaeella lactis]QUA54485.1 hypothetical protein JYE50_07825 [Aristaeella lactis]SMC48290.1 extracellular solute-binding protein, family 5 Middle [Aristaeella lactis]
MNKLQRFLCLLLSVLLLTQAPLLAMAEATEDAAGLPEELIVGHPTVTKGDFFTELFGNDTADIDVRALIHGYNLVNWDQNQGTYVFDPSVVQTIGPVEVDELGNHTYKMIIYDDLYYSDGTPITAWDYAFSILLMMSPEIEAIGGKIYRAEHLMGYDDYIATRKKILAGEELTDDDVRSLSGVEVHSDHEIWFHLDADFLPYFFETGLLLTVPYPISVIAPGCKVYDDGFGIYLGNADPYTEEPVFTPELLKKTILDPETGYNSHPSVVSGPYKMVSWDAATGEGHYEINPYFKGAWMHNNLPGPDYSGPVNYVQVMDIDNETPKLDANGQEIWLVKPTIEKIKFVVADNDTMMQQLADGELHLVNKVTYGPTILDGLQNGRDKGIAYQNYRRIGLAFLTFTYDWPTVHDMEVRQAIAWCMDRDLLGALYCGSEDGGQTFALRVDGYYGMEQWEYKLLSGELSYPVNFLDQVTLPQVQVKDGEEEDLTKKYKNRYVETQEDYEKAVAAWEALAKEWGDKLVKYTVDLSKAKKLLEKAGWTLNRNGEPFQEGTDDVRCKKMEDGSIVALDLTLMYPAGNHMAELMQTAVRSETNISAREGSPEPDADAGSFVDNLARVGIKLTLVPTPMEELLKSYYRQTERTTDMIYLATNFHVIVDPSITYSTDTTKNHEIWNNTYSDDEELWIDAKAMRKTEPGDIFEYVSKWVTFQERYNEVLPTIPIYSNVYFDFYNENLQNYYITGQVTWSQAILPSYFALENEPAAEEDGEFESFDD